VDQPSDAHGSALTRTQRERTSTCVRTLGALMLVAAAASCSSGAAQGLGSSPLQSRPTEVAPLEALLTAATGSLGVDAAVTAVMDPTTVCPTIASFSVTPAEAVVGTPMNVRAFTDPSGAAVTYTVEEAGTGTGMGTPTLTTTGETFTCTVPGQLALIATTTAPLANNTGSCPPQSMSALITCDPVQVVVPAPTQVVVPALPRWALATLAALLLITAKLATRRDRERQT
jgi:hypothetical protein